MPRKKPPAPPKDSIALEMDERMALIERFALVFADPECQGDCDGTGIDQEGGEWTLCECALNRLLTAERSPLQEQPPAGRIEAAARLVMSHAEYDDLMGYWRFEGKLLADPYGAAEDRLWQLSEALSAVQEQPDERESTLEPDQAAVTAIVTVSSREDAEGCALQIQELLDKHLPERFAAISVELPAVRDTEQQETPQEQWARESNEHQARVEQQEQEAQRCEAPTARSADGKCEREPGHDGEHGPRSMTEVIADAEQIEKGYGPPSGEQEVAEAPEGQQTALRYLSELETTILRCAHWGATLKGHLVRDIAAIRPALSSVPHAFDQDLSDAGDRISELEEALLLLAVAHESTLAGEEDHEEQTITGFFERGLLQSHETSADKCEARLTPEGLLWLQEVRADLPYQRAITERRAAAPLPSGLEGGR
jgi:hypothetical protein